MKKILSIIALAIIGFGAIPTTFVSCTSGLSGSGVDSIEYIGVKPPQDDSYRNPVWEPDFELGTVFKGAADYVAIASEVQWVSGLTYCAPVMTSTNLMEWTFNPDRMAFPSKPDTVGTTIYKRPDWAEGRIHSMAGGFARTIASYMLFYQIGSTPEIGVSFATSPMGPYSDLGKLMDNTNTASNELKDPFFIVVGTRFLLLFSTENGSYIQEMTIRKGQKPVLKGDPIRLSTPQFTDVAVYRKGDYFYLFGTVENGEKTEIHYGRAEAVTGPYYNQAGNDLVSNSGTVIIESGAELVNPQNVCGIFADFNEDDFIMYNVTDNNKPTLANGSNRRPLVLNKLNINEEGWIEGVIKPLSGWTSPKFIDK